MLLKLLGLSTFAFTFTVCQAQTPASNPPASRSSSAIKSQPASGNDSQQPLPDLNTLIHQVLLQQRASWKTLQQYTYRSFNSEQDLDSHGTVKATTTVESEILCVDVACFTKVLAVNGKSLSDDAMKQQNENIDTSIAAIKERNAHTAAAQPSQKKKNANGVSYESFLADFLQVGPQLGTFSNLRRVDRNGRETIAIDYMGNPHAKSPTLLEGVFRNLSGTVWVDEQDHALARIEGRVYQDYKVGGGLLADIHKGATVQMEWTRVNNEVWLPGTFNGRGSARILVFAYHSAALDHRWSDYRKFRTTSTILPTESQVDMPQSTDGAPHP